MQITSSGFQFLLMDTASQVWYFILKYLETVSERGLNLESCLTFLFKLSFFTLGKVRFHLFIHSGCAIQPGWTKLSGGQDRQSTRSFELIS